MKNSPVLTHFVKAPAPSLRKSLSLNLNPFYDFQIDLKFEVVINRYGGKEIGME